MALLPIVAACGATSGAAEKAAKDVSDVFLIALRGGHWKTAFNRLGPGMREECGGEPHELARRAIARFEARLTDWQFGVESTYRDLVVLGGEVTREGREPVTVGIVAKDDGEQWRISTFEVNGIELCRPLDTTDHPQEE